jgi:hypothetical protein
MKAPINFSKRLHGYSMDVFGYEYILTTIASMDSSLWITPIDVSPKAIMLVFNWNREQYDIVPISRISGRPDYPRSIQDQTLNPTPFKTFDSFIEALRSLIYIHKDLFS